MPGKDTASNAAKTVSYNAQLAKKVAQASSNAAASSAS